jgi:hypothetical protein
MSTSPVKNLARTALLLVALFATARVVQAEVSYETRFASAGVKVNECQRMADDWNRQATIGAVLLVVTVSLGLVIAVVQALSRSNEDGAKAGRATRLKVATAIMGAIVSTATVVNTTALDGDYRTLKQRASRAQSFLDSARSWLEIKKTVTTDEDRDVILQEIEGLLKRFSQLATAPQAAGSAALNLQLPWPESTLHASGQTCECLSRSPQQTGFLYVCGTGQAASISAAKAQATTKAMDAIVALLQRQADKATQQREALAAYGQRLSSEVNSCVKRAKGQFEVSVVLRIPSILAESRAQEAFGVASGAAAPDLFAGRWKLNRSRSQMGIYNEVVEDVRDVHIMDASQSVSWRRVLRNGHVQVGTHDVPCDGREHVTSGETMACLRVGPGEIQGHVKTPGHKPPILYSHTKVTGNIMTITTYADEGRKQRISTLVYDRVPL